jgi:hypothetical protein
VHYSRSLRVPVPAATLFAWHERPGACVLTDEVELALPFGAIGAHAELARLSTIDTP